MNNKHRILSGLALTVFSFFSASTLAQELPQIWQLTNDVELQADKAARDALGPVSVSVSPSVVSSFKRGNQYHLPVFGQTLNIELLNQKRIKNTIVWQAQNLDSPALPAIQMFLNDGELTAWVPTTKGTYRLENGRLIKEFKMRGTRPDFKLPYFDTLRALPGLASEAKVIRAPKQSAESNAVPKKASSRTQAAGDLNYRVLFVVTNEFVATYPDTDGKLTEYVTTNNAIYEASNINVQMINAGFIQADLEQYTSDQLLDNLSSNGGEDSTDGDIPDETLNPIWQARVDNAADFIVVMMNDLPEGLCGQGWLNGDANQVFSYDFAVNVTAAFTTFGNFPQPCGMDTLGHELGHNMGLAHSFAQGEEGTVFTFGRGYGVEDQFATVMAYAQEFGNAEDVALFSSPDITCLNDLACGVDQNESDGADAVYSVNQVKEEISLIHNDEVTSSISAALEEVSDSGLSSCISDSFPSAFVNEQVDFLTCYDYTINTIEGIQNFPSLNTIGISGSDDTDLEMFRSMRNLLQLDVRSLFLTSLRPIAHVKDQLTFLQFNASSLSCQDLNAAMSWEIDTFSTLGNCQSLDDDSEDFDSDGISNLDDTDDDNDGIDDISDALPRDASNADDIDNDGVTDANDAFPYDENESEDTDGDTVGNNSDSDDDNDGVPDAQDCAPLDNAISANCSDGSGDGGNTESDFAPYDYDGDGTADVGVRRASNFFQYILNSDGGDIQRIQFGRNAEDISVSGDFDGDNIADVAVRRPSNQFWYISNSSDGETQRFNFGLQSEDIPVPADYDGDGITDVAVRRPASFFWFIRNSSGVDPIDGNEDGTSRVRFGLQEADIPVPGDYDGDDKADVAVRRPGNFTWYIRNSSGIDPVDGNGDGLTRLQFGLQEEDIPVPADYDGDGIDDVAVRRPGSFFWFIRNSSGVDPIDGNDDGISRVRFGLQEADIPIPADYDGDGKADIAVRRPSNQIQYILRSSDGEIERIQFGRNTADMPLAAPILTRMETTISTDTDADVARDEEEIQVERRLMSSAESRAEEVN